MENQQEELEIQELDLRGIILAGDIPKSVTDPVVILNQWMDLPGVNIHGPEHHVLDGAALLAALDNWFSLNPERAAGLHAWRQGLADELNKGAEEEDLEKPAMDLASAVDELMERAREYPGGACGYLGVCGAAVSAGTAFSIFSVNTPYSEETWSQNAELTGRILTSLSTCRGPRCCKRNAYFALETASDFLKEKYQIDLKVNHDIKCHYYDRNQECLFSECPYF